MDQFEFHNPVKIIFGKGKAAAAGSYVSHIASSVLLCYGQGSIKKNGVFHAVTESLKQNGISWTELPDIQPNPLLSRVRQGIDIVRQNNLEAVMAVGGGSVMDTAKAIAAGAVMREGDIWDCFRGRKEIEGALPVVTVPTLAASGSEMNGFMVITHEENHLKLAAGSPFVYPAVSILDPEVTYTVPPDYTAYGGVDAVCHLLEPFFNRSWPDTPVQDEITYGLIRAIVKATDRCLATPANYNARANLMWGATLALNGLTKAGVGEHFFPVHLIEHSVSALFGVPHGAGLAALLPGWMEWFMSQGHAARISDLGRGIYGVDPRRAIEETASETIELFARWLESSGCPSSLESLSISPEDHGAIAENALVQAGIWGIDKNYNIEVIMHILARCQRR
jgi:alcohol dehydrogenase YqhD (iron-dependent ADH family)